MVNLRQPDVKGKRSDGYHELETVMHQVNLLDIIIISGRRRY